MARAAGRIIAVVALALAAGACVRWGGGEPGPQGWSSKDREFWYHGTQGSRLIPYDWALALEQKNSAQPFMDDAHIAGFGYLPAQQASGKPLPVGFALDRGSRERGDADLSVSRLRWYDGQGADATWMGMNCAACHTAEIAVNGQRLRIDGGPSLTDFQSFIEALDDALEATAADPGKFDRFAGKVLAGRDTPANRALLKDALARLIAWNDTVDKANETPLRYGPARVDAFGHIYNKVALFANPNPSAPPPPMPSDAPVSFPFLWNTHQHDRVQWNGVAENKVIKVIGAFDYGAMGRNTGQVIGVFGDVVTAPNPGLKGYESSVQIRYVEALESVLSRLKPPAWPTEVMGPIDQALAAEGRPLFAAQCESCHAVLAPDDLKSPITAKMSLFRAQPEAERTDPWMACNAFTREAPAGNLEGQPKGYIGSGPKLETPAPVANMLSTMVVGTLVGKKEELIRTGVEVFLGVAPRPPVITEAVIDEKAARLAACLAATDADDPSGIVGYKARPLNGIWATAPYLHNGSVPTLHDLLLPPEQRPARFWLGTREYDPVKVGYRTDQAAPGQRFEFVTKDAAGEWIAGNGAQGHVYGVGALNARQRAALVEYMKTL